jgi:pilus assembly protein Flp/PilA
VRVMRDKFYLFLRDEEGQTSTEYILLVAVVALIVFKFKKIATEKLTNLTDSIFNNATNSIENEF